MLADPRLVAARELLGGTLVKAAVARAQDLARSGAISPASVADAAAASLPQTAATLTPVINATGVLVHTNLGRAPLSAAPVVECCLRRCAAVRSAGARSRSECCLPRLPSLFRSAPRSARCHRSLLRALLAEQGAKVR